MRRVPSWVISCVLITVLAGPLLAQSSKGKCSGKGVFARSTKDGNIEYCWYGEFYTEADAPAHVTDFFAEAVEKRRAAKKRTASTQRTAVPARPVLARASQPRAVRTVTASTKPVAAPVGAELLASIETGADCDEVLAILGKPHGSIGNLGEESTEEVWSYQLQTGGFAKIRFDQRKVTAVRLPQ